MKNSGLKATGSFTINAYRSTNSNITVNDTQVKTGTINSLNAGSAVTYNFGIVVPKLAAGTKVYFGCYADPANTPCSE